MQASLAIVHPDCATVSYVAQVIRDDVLLCRRSLCINIWIVE